MFIRQHVHLAQLFMNLVSKDDRFEVMFKSPTTLGLVCFRLKNVSNDVNERFLKALNDDKRIYLVPAVVKEKFILRFCICSWLTEEKHIQFAWETIDQVATKLLLQC